MPTQSDPRLRRQWRAQSDAPKRSVFRNYGPSAAAPSPPAGGDTRQPPTHSEPGVGLQAGIDRAVARSFIYRFLAVAYADPAPESWEWLSDARTQESLQGACRALAPHALTPPSFQRRPFETFLNAYLAAFGHAARGSCPLNEIDYGDLKADPLFQPHRLADLAAFYRAFGLEVAEQAGERHDHICLELEFMCVLAAKQAYGLEHQLDPEQLAQCGDAERKFLREHLGRWAPAFTRRLAATATETTLQELAAFTRGFIEAECTRFGVTPGSEELALRPVDQAADRMCDSCGIHNLPPGAQAPS